MSKNCLITGITGMVGSHLCDFLLKETDWKVFGFCRWNDDLNNIRHLFDNINCDDRIELVYGDLNDYPSLTKAINLSKLALMSNVIQKCFQSFLAFLSTNMM